MNVELQKQHAIDLHSKQADLFASRYGDVEAEAYHDCFAYSRKRLRCLLERYLSQQAAGTRLLDVGCGTGHHLAELRERGFTVAGVDGSPVMLEHARALNPGAEVRLADVEALPFPDRSFDFVLCIEVLRYLPDPLQCLKEIARVLRPGGCCLVTALPLLNLNAYWLVNRVAYLTHVKGLVPLKQYFATSWGLRRDFLTAGFQPPTIHGVYFGPVNWVERLTPRLLPRFLKRWEPIDVALADRAWRDLSNMFLVHAVRRPSDEVPHGGA